MARKPRFTLPGVPQHVIQRGHNGEPCFYSEQNYIRYLADLREAAERNQVAIHAYVLMANYPWHHTFDAGHMPNIRSLYKFKLQVSVVGCTGMRNI